MQFHEVEFKPFQEFWKYLTDPHFPSFNFVVAEDPFENVDHLTLDHQLIDMFGNDRNQPA
jgi:hypothetical protein